MQLKYRYFFGGDHNPFEKEVAETYRKLSEERKLADYDNKEPIGKVLPTLDSWPKYVIAESKSTFWQMERAISKNSEAQASGVEVIWKEALGQRKVDKWILLAEGDETEKAMCYYMKVLHEMFIPNDISVDFRLYFSESSIAKRIDTNDGVTLMPYEG